MKNCIEITAKNKDAFPCIINVVVLFLRQYSMSVEINLVVTNIKKGTSKYLKLMVLPSYC